MSDVPLGASLLLDIQAALQRVDQLGAQIDRTTSNISVTVGQVDAVRVTTAIDTAVAAADTDVEVEGQARRVTSAIDSAVDAADTEVEVEGTARGVTGAIDAAVEAADTNVEVTADTSPAESALRRLSDADRTVVIRAQVDQAQRALAALDRQIGEATTPQEVQILVDQRNQAATKLSVLRNQLGEVGKAAQGAQKPVEELGDDLGDAADSGSRLSSVLSVAALAGAATGLVKLAMAASDLEQAVGGTEAIFGEARGAVDEFARGAATAAGLTETAARTMTSQIGGLLKGFGFTREEAAKTSIQLAQLGADLAATFGGNPEEAVMALGAALRGEFDPLERFGVSLNVAQIEAYALEKGLAATKEEVTGNVRAQAALQLILERSADAQGQFGREAATAGGAVAQLKAEAGNLSADLGANLTPAFITLVQALRQDVLPGLSEAGENVLPQIGDAIANLAPLLGTTTQLLVTLSPVIGAFASFLAAIPSPLVAVAAGLLAFNKASSLLGPGIKTLSGGIGTLFSGISQLASERGVSKASAGMGVLRSSIVAINPLTIALTVGMFALTSAMEKNAATQRRIREATSELNQALKDQDGQLRVTAEGLTEFFSNAEGRGGKTAKTLREVGLSVDELTLAIMSGQDAGKILNASLDEGAKLGWDQAVALKETEEALKRTITAQLDAALASGAITEKQYEQATSSDDLIGAYRQLTDQIDEHGKRVASLREEYGPIVETFEQTAGALGKVRDASPQLAREIAGLTDGVGSFDEELLHLVGTFIEASLSEKEMEAAAAALGITVGDLEGIIENIDQALGDFVDTASGALPTVADAFKAAGDDSILSISEFVGALKQSTADMDQFVKDLDVITKAGFTTLAGTIAQQGPEVGGALAREMAKAIESGNTELVAGAAKALNDFNQQWNFNTNYLRTVLGPQFILETGLIGSLASGTFGENVDLATRIRIASELAKSELDSQGQSIAALAALEGAEAAFAYGTEILKLPASTVEAMIGVGLAIADGTPTVSGNARTLGTTTADEYLSGLSPVGPYTAEQLAIAAGLFAADTTVKTGSGDVARNAAAAYYEALGVIGPLTDEQIDAAIAIITGAAPEAGTAGATTGKAAKDGYQSEVDQVKPTTETAFNAAVDGIRNLFPKFGEEGGNAGRTARERYKAEVDPVAPTTEQVFNAAVAGIRARMPEFGTAGRQVGSASAQAYGGALGPGISDSTRLAMLGGVTQLTYITATLTRSAWSLGHGVGQSFGSGIAAGIDSYVGNIRRAAAKAVYQAEQAARAEARSQSPSKLFAALGMDLGRGIEQGLENSTRDVGDAAAAVIRHAAGTVAGLGPVTFDAVAASPASRADAYAAPSVTWTGNLVVQVDGATDEATARRVGVVAAEGFMSQLQRRRALASAIRAEGR